MSGISLCSGREPTVNRLTVWVETLHLYRWVKGRLTHEEEAQHPLKDTHNFYKLLQLGFFLSHSCNLEATLTTIRHLMPPEKKKNNMFLFSQNNSIRRRHFYVAIRQRQQSAHWHVMVIFLQGTHRFTSGAFTVHAVTQGTTASCS